MRLIWVPCTNCVAFSIECRFRASKDKQSRGRAKVQAARRTLGTPCIELNFDRAPITDPGCILCFGKSSNLSLLVCKPGSTTDVVHYLLPAATKTWAQIQQSGRMESIDLDILHQRGAFLLPPRPVCDELIEAFFT